MLYISNVRDIIMSTKITCEGLALGSRMGVGVSLEFL